MIKKRIGVYLICFVLVAGYLLSGTLVKKEESHAIIVDWAVGKALDSALNIVNGLFLEVMGKAIDETENETMKNIEETIVDADNLILAGSLDDSSEKILKELDEMKSQMTNLGNSIEDTLNQLFAYDVKTKIEDMQKNIHRINKDFVDVQTAYSDYVEAGNSYAQAILDESKGKVDSKKVDDAKNELLKKQKLLEEEFQGESFQQTVKNNLKELAKNCCMYQPGYTTDVKKGRTKNVKASATYLGQVWTSLNLTQPFDHQKYEGMEAAVNDSAQAFTMLLSAARIYYDYYTVKYEHGGEEFGDPDTLGDWYLQMANGVVHCLNDLGEQCRGKDKASEDYKEQVDLTTDVTMLMRPYDVETTKELNYEQKQEHVVKSKNYSWSLVTYSNPYTSTATDTKPSMDFYRAALNGTPYLFLKKPGVDGRGLVYHPSYDVSFFSGQDYFNLLMSKDGIYRMPVDYTQVAALTDSDAYAGAKGNLLSYLRGNGGLADLPEKADYVVTSEKRDIALPKYNLHLTERVSWCSTVINKDNTKAAKVEMDLDDVFSDAGKDTSKKIIAMMVGDKKKKERSSVSVKLSDNRGDVKITRADGSDITGSSVEAGTELSLKVTIAKGAQLRSLKWVSKDGKTKETIATGDSLSLAQAEKDGSYVFTYPMPYQDCTFRADFANAEEGEGSQENPYLISSAQDLADYAVKAADDAAYNKANYKLTRDIDSFKEKVSVGRHFGEGAEGFTGVFDGGGHTITGFDRLGGFASIGKGGVVRNLMISTGEQSRMEFGGLLAWDNNGVITGCGVLANDGRPVENSYVTGGGAIVKVNRETGIIENSYNNLSINCSNPSAENASMAAENQGIIRNCYNTGNLTSPNPGSGGISAINHNGSTVFNCYNAGAVSGSVFSGEPGSKLSDVFYQTGNGVFSAAGTGLSEAQMKGDDLLKALNKNVAKTEGLDQWLIKEGVNNGYPILGTVPDRYTISTDIKGKGSLTISDDEGQEIHKAVGGVKVKAEAAPGDGRQVSNLKLYDEKGKTIEKLEVKPDEKGIVKASFKMPDQNVTVHVKFVKKEDAAENKQEKAKDNSDGKTKPENGFSQKGDGSPVYDQAVLTDSDTGIVVSGEQIDTRAVLKVEAYDKTDPQRIEIEEGASDDVLSAYDVSLALVDAQGKEVNSGTEKFKGTLDVAFPIAESDRDKELKVLHGSEAGLNFEDGGLKDDGLYHVEVSHLSPFAVVEYAEDLEANLSNGETIDTGSSVAWIWIIAGIAAAGIIIAVLIVRKRKKERRMR